MDEMYFEQIVEKNNEKNIAICRFAIVLGSIGLFAAGYFLMKGTLFLAGVVLALAGFMVIIPRFYVEYEYLYMSKELSVDKIYNKESRKKMGSYELTGMTVMAKEGSDELKYVENRQGVVHDYTSGDNENGVYVIVMNDQKGTRIRFEPNEEILKAIRQQFPRQAKY